MPPSAAFIGMAGGSQLHMDFGFMALFNYA
jgi:hypothetical protein